MPYEVLRKAAFRRWPLGEKQQRGPINRVVFESQSMPTVHFRASDEIPRVRREQGRPDLVFLKPTSTVADQTPGTPAVKTTASAGQDIR